MASPLMIGCDVRNVDEDTVKLLGNSYEPIRDAFRLSVENTAEATALILEHP